MKKRLSQFLSYKITSREDAVFCVTLAVTVSVIALSLFSLFLTIMHHRRVGLDLAFPGIAVLLIISMVMLRSRRSTSGIYLFLLSVFILVLLMDYRIPKNYGPTILLYVLPVSFCIFLVESRFLGALFSSLFLAAFVIRTLFFTDLEVLGDLFVFLLVALSVITMVVVKNLLTALSDHKLKSIEMLHTTTLRILGNVSEVKDRETANHLKRVEMTVKKLVQLIRKNRRYSRYITLKYIDDIRSAAFLHDIGKIGIPDAILFKKGKLTEEEYNIIKSHSVIGYELIADAIKDLEGQSIYSLALEIVRHHHERWDGKGYPDGLSGMDIPLSARIMAVADVYDALISRRPYKEPFTHDRAVQIISEGRGTQFDPDIVDAFMKHSDEFQSLIRDLIE